MMALISCYALINQLGLFKGRINIICLSYYTIQSNMLVLAYLIFAIIYMIRHWTVLSAETMSPFAVVKGGVTYAITITALVYNFILSPTFSMKASFTPHRWADCILHIYIPMFAIMDWLAFDHKPSYKILDPLKWQMIPIFYFIFALCRAEIGGLLTQTSRYPYFFIDIDKIGFPAVMRNAVILLMCFIVLAYIFYGIDVLLGRVNKRKRILP